MTGAASHTTTNQHADEAIEDFAHKLWTWAHAYPPDVFGEDLSKDESKRMVQALRDGGFTSERVHASWARHIIRVVSDDWAELQPALEALRVRAAAADQLANALRLVVAYDDAVLEWDAIKITPTTPTSEIKRKHEVSDRSTELSKQAFPAARAALAVFDAAAASPEGDNT